MVWTMTNDFFLLLQSHAIQTVLRLVSPAACNCVSLGSVMGGVCEVYGGQCPCVTAAVGFDPINGRQCDLCPFYTYVTAEGCAGETHAHTANPSVALSDEDTCTILKTNFFNS